MIRVQVVFAAAPGTLDTTPLQLPAGSSVADAIRTSGLLQRHPQAATLPVGVWGRKQVLDTPLREGDRVEVYRPLQCDPKEARRLRYRQRAESAARARQAGGPQGDPVAAADLTPKG